MLERLQLTNFQKHRRFRLILDPHLTTIVGPSDRGKSAIIRAIRWLMLNRPLGDEFVNWDEPDLRCEVRAQIDGRMVSRARGKEENIYTLDGNTFKSFAQDVPAELAALFNVTELNFNDQLDDPYWFKEPPAQVSRNLNSIVNLEIIDETLRTLSANKKKAATKVELCNERLVTATAAAEDLKYVTKLDADLREVERLDDYSYRTALTAEGLRHTATATREAQLTHRTAAEAHAAGAVVVAAGDRAVAARRAVEGLNGLVVKIREAAAAKSVKVPDTGTIESLYKTAVSKKAEAGLLCAQYNAATLAATNLSRAQEKLALALKEFEQKVGSQCPICGSPMTLSA